MIDLTGGWPLYSSVSSVSLSAHNNKSLLQMCVVLVCAIVLCIMFGTFYEVTAMMILQVFRGNVDLLCLIYKISVVISWEVAMCCIISKCSRG